MKALVIGLMILTGIYVIGAITTFILSMKYVPGISFVSREDRAMMHAIGWPIGLPLVIGRMNKGDA